MQLAHTYAQHATRAMQVTHVIAGSEPDEFRRLFHGWQSVSVEPDPHARRQYKMLRRLGMAGRVLRTKAWPGQESWDNVQREAGEEVVSSGVVIFWTSCGIVRRTDRLCRAARALMEQKGERFLDVNLAREPSEVPTLQLLLKANGLAEAHAKDLPVVFVNGRLLAGGGGPPLQQLEDEGALSSALRAAQSPPLQVAERKGESLPTLRQVLAGDGAQAPLRQGWLLKEGAVFRRWQRRYCVLVHGSIYYFKGTDASGAALGTIPLAGSTSRVLNSDFHFEIVTPRRVFLLRVDRADERGVLSSMSALFGGGGGGGGGGGEGGSAALSQRSREPSVQASQRSEREPSVQGGASASAAAAAAAAAAGGGESDANAASRSGKDLAA